MGQKTNPNILRLGKTKEWKSKYFEKKTNDLLLYTFNDLEIKKFIYKFFELNGLNVNNCKLYYSENHLHIFISYFSTLKTNLLINKLNEQQKIKLKLKQTKSKRLIKKNLILNKKNFIYKNYNKKYFYVVSLSNINQKFYSLIKLNLKQHTYSNLKFKRLKTITNYKKYFNIKKHKNIKNMQNNLFIQKLFKSLNLFIKKKLNIILSLEQLNQDTNIIQTFSKKKKKTIASTLIKLRKFKQNEFFKQGINLFYNYLTNPHNTQQFANYIALYFKKLKKPNFFLRFIQTTLKLFINKNFSKIKRLQIIVKGRFNGASRARSKTLKIGKGLPPILTIASNIDYSEATAYSRNGTFGVKVWAYKK